MTKHRKYFCS